MARRVTSRVGIAGVGVIDGDTGFRELARGVSVVANEGASMAFSGLANVRTAQATQAARQASLPRNPRGDLVSPTRTRETAFPSLYSETYDNLLQKRFLNELGIEAAEKFADYHNRSQADPDQFRILADSYIENVLEGVGDDAYEPARAFLQNRASQHYTSIANRRAEMEYEQGAQSTRETLSRVLNDGFNNAAMTDVDDEARAAQAFESRALLEAELQFATEPDINYITPAQADQIRDQYDTALALGAAQRAARPIFMEATEPGDVDLLAARAAEQASENISPEVETLLGGPEKARAALDAVIKLGANQHKINLAVRNMRELREFENVQRSLQSELVESIRSGNDNNFLAAAMMVDPEMFRNPKLREQATSVLSRAIGHGQAMERMEGSLDAQQIELEKWWNSPERKQVIAAADTIGVPMTEGGELDFAPDMLMNAEGLQTAVHLTNQLLSVLDKPASGSGAADENAPMDHLERWWETAQGVADAMNVDIQQIAEQAAQGDPDATATMRQIEQQANQGITPHSWTKGEREDIDTGPMAKAAAGHFGMSMEAMQREGDHLWQLAMNDSPALAGRFLADFERLGGISESAHEFMKATGLEMAHGDGAPEPRNIGAAMALYGVLKKSPSAMNNANLPDEVVRGLDNLWRSGFRGAFGDQGFVLDGGSPIAAQGVFRQDTGVGDNKARFAAMGLDPDKASVDFVRTWLKDRYQDDWFADTAYSDQYESFAHDYVMRRAADGVSPNAAMKELAEENGNQIGWGKSYIVLSPSVRQGARQGAIIPEAPSLLIRNEEWRQKPDLIEKEVQSIIAERFSHIDGVGDNADRIFLTGVGYERMGRYTGRTDLVSPRQMTGMAFVRDDRNNMVRDIELHDENGFPVILDLNELYAEAIMRRSTRQWERQMLLRDLANAIPESGAP